jgi:hypothetical protein
MSANGCCCHIWVKRGVRDLHLVLLCVRDFRENRRREGHDFFFLLIGVHEITLTRVQLNCIAFESKERLGQVWVLRHTFALLLCCATVCRCEFFKCPAVHLLPVHCESAAKFIDCHFSIL